jgi:glutaredoxin
MALADDGKCVLCRRTSRPTTAELYGGSADRGGLPWGLVALVSLLAAAAVAAAIVVVTRRSLGPVSVAAEPRRTARRPESSSGLASSGVAPSAPRERADAPQPPPVTTVKWVSEPVTEVVPPASDVMAIEQAARARALARQQAEFEAWAHREANREIEEQEARARRSRGEPEPATRGGKPNAADVLGRVPITMYSASWCGACSAARAFFKGAQIPFTERDVDTDALAASEARRLNPRGSIPTIDVAGTTIVGFRPSAIIAAIQNAAGHR